MDLTLTRNDFKDDGIFGVLENGNNLVAVTLEHSYDDLPKIPAGFYACVRGTHELENGVPFETFEITGVPGHTGLLFHKGNFDNDSKGCVLLGSARTGDIVIGSKPAFDRFMALQKGVDRFVLQVVSYG